MHFHLKSNFGIFQLGPYFPMFLCLMPGTHYTRIKPILGPIPPSRRWSAKPQFFADSKDYLSRYSWGVSYVKSVFYIPLSARKSILAAPISNCKY